jgi:hypothetical protein
VNYAVEMGSGFIKIVSGIQKLIARESETHREHDNRISIFFFQNKDSKLKILSLHLLRWSGESEGEHQTYIRCQSQSQSQSTNPRRAEDGAGMLRRR